MLLKIEPDRINILNFNLNVSLVLKNKLVIITRKKLEFLKFIDKNL